MAKKQKLTRHNGRSGKNGVYNPKHNDRSFDPVNSEHIDSKRVDTNIYWDCYQGYSFPKDREEEDSLISRFEEIEKDYYDFHYSDYCSKQHERNKSRGHSERDRSPDDLRLSKKTCPEETLLQIGTMEDHVSPDILFQVAVDFFTEFHERYGKHIHILDWSLHLDESTPHIHERHVFDCENQYGEIAPQQEKALEALGFQLPFPDKKISRSNNRKIVFDEECRKLLFEISRKYGLNLETEAVYGGKKYLEKNDFILEKQKEQIYQYQHNIDDKEYELFSLKNNIADKHSELNDTGKRLQSLTLQIQDTESFIEEISEAALSKAVEVVKDVTIEEIRNEDFKIISDFRDTVTSPSNRNTPAAKKIASEVLSALMKKFRGMTTAINEKLSALFTDPAGREALKQPVKESILAKLRENKDTVSAPTVTRHKKHENEIGG